MKLAGGKTSSWNDIMSNGKFGYLPTTSPPNEEAPDTTTTPSPKAKTKPKSPYSALIAKIKTAKSKAVGITRRKKQKPTHNGTNFLHQMPSTTAAVHDRLGILIPIAVPASQRSTIATPCAHHHP